MHPHVQIRTNTLGAVNLNYTESNGEFYYAFEHAGDYVLPDFLDSLSRIVESGVKVVSAPQCTPFLTAQ